MPSLPCNLVSRVQISLIEGITDSLVARCPCMVWYFLPLNSLFTRSVRTLSSLILFATNLVPRLFSFGSCGRCEYFDPQKPPSCIRK